MAEQGAARGRVDPFSTRFLRGLRLDEIPVETVAVDRLSVEGSPRLDGENDAHTRQLAELGVPLPPIIVHRATLRVIDGVHRLRAAVLRGATEIEAQYFDGTDEEAFVLAVEANVRDGLPLTRADRKAAAAKIVLSHPHWSDRMIASATGLAPNTVGTVRRGAAVEGARSHTRLGRDGRIRPVNTEEGRKLARQMIVENPDASLREIAKAAGISPGTVRDVRERLRRGENQAAPPKQARTSVRRECTELIGQPEHAQPRTPVAALRNLKTDPSLRFSETGRVLLRLLDVHSVDVKEWERLADALPAHAADVVSDLARGCARNWEEFATLLERRRRATA